MDIERGLVGPQFQQREFVGVQHTLKYLELFAAGFLRDVGAALPEGLREFRPFAWGRVDTGFASTPTKLSTDSIPIKR